MARYSLSDIVTFKRAEEQTRDVLKQKVCPCGRPIKLGWEEILCMSCRQRARRNARRANGQKD